MCGIGIAKALRLVDILKGQKDRGYDSIGITNGNHILKRVFKEFDEYISLLNEANDNDKLFLMHHRKATIGEVNLDNAHPFKGKYFTLMQNGTSRIFYRRYKMHFRKDTDSENLLCYIERATKKLSDIPRILDKLAKKIDDTFGNIVVTDGEEVLFYTDGSRESYIDIDDGRVIEITNYKNGLYGYKNKGYLLFDYHGNILDIKMENINKEYFYTQVTTNYQRPYDSGDYRSHYGDIPYAKNQQKLLNSGCDTNIKSIIEGYYQDEYEVCFDWLYVGGYYDGIMGYSDYLLGRISLDELFNNFLMEIYGVISKKQYKDNFGDDYPLFVFEQAMKDVG